jgi:GNAT superfamily N-acetyltransferase
VSDSGAAQEAVVHVVTNAELREGTPPGDDPDTIAAISPNKRAALLSNPLLGPEDEPAQILFRLDDRLVGRLDLLAGEIETPEGPAACFWGSALQVSPAYRGRQLGATLLRASEQFREATAACAASRMSRPLYSRLGYLDLALRRHVLLRRTGPLLEPRLGNGALGRSATAAGDAVAGGHGRLLELARRRRAGSLALEQRDVFPRELEPRLREGPAPFSMHRSAAWVDWVLRESFTDEQRRALYLVTTGGGEPVAYMLVKARVYSSVTRWNLENFHLGSLVDWRIFEPAVVGLEQLVLLALEALAAWNVAGVEVCVPEHEPDRLRRLGFLPAGAQHVFVRGSEGSALARPQAREARAWWLRPAEGDHVFS